MTVNVCVCVIAHRTDVTVNVLILGGSCPCTKQHSGLNFNQEVNTQVIRCERLSIFLFPFYSNAHVVFVYQTADDTMALHSVTSRFN